MFFNVDASWLRRLVSRLKMVCQSQAKKFGFIKVMQNYEQNYGKPKTLQYISVKYLEKHH